MENSNKLTSQNINFDGDEIDLKSLFKKLKKGKKLIFLIVLSSTFITAIYSFKRNPSGQEVSISLLTIILIIAKFKSF